MQILGKTDRSLKLVSILTAMALLFSGVPFARLASAAQLINRYDKLSSSEASAVATHEVGFTFGNLAVPVGSISLEFCGNDPLPNTPCTPPSGFDATGVSLDDQAGEIGFSVDPSSSVNKIILTRPAALPTSTPSTYTLGNIINPDTIGTFYIRLQTFTSTDGTGVDIEAAGLALSTSAKFTVSTEVPPYLTFCSSVTISGDDCTSATSFLIDMGEFVATKSSSATSEFVVQTNAQSGYSVTLSGSTLTSGNNTITALAVPTTPQKGTPQFGMNLRANSNPSIGADPSGLGLGIVGASYGVPNKFTFRNGDIIASAGAPDYEKYTVTYIANVNSTQAPGFYATTISFICLANF